MIKLLRKLFNWVTGKAIENEANEILAAMPPEIELPNDIDAVRAIRSAEFNKPKEKNLYTYFGNLRDDREPRNEQLIKACHDKINELKAGLC